MLEPWYDFNIANGALMIWFLTIQRSTAPNKCPDRSMMHWLDEAEAVFRLAAR